MPLEIVPYQPQHEAAVAEFNARARAHDAPFTLSKTPQSEWLPNIPGRAVRREFFLALDGCAVRGGFTLRRQEFLLRGKIAEIANYQGPLSEGIWDRRFMMVGVQMLRAALRDQPLLYALGMGGPAQPLPRLLSMSGWSMTLVPFHFKVLRAAAFLRNIQPLRTTPWRARLLDFASAMGAGEAIRAWQWHRSATPCARQLNFSAPTGAAKINRTRPWFRSADSQRLKDCTCTAVSEFGAWAEEVWKNARLASIAAPEPDPLSLTAWEPCHFGAVRDRTAQNVLFGDGNPANIILRCLDAGADIGWAVVRSTQMRGDQYFGNMRLGSIVDCLAVPDQEYAVIALATEHLRGLASDLIVSNQMHSEWRQGLRFNGFLDARSNFLFATSPALTAALGGEDYPPASIHINRADGDGPIHL